VGNDFERWKRIKVSMQKALVGKHFAGNTEGVYMTGTLVLNLTGGVFN
jgi:hypothetical protein